MFHSISRRIDYRTVSFPLSRLKASIVNELKDIYKIYNARGFKITDIHADNEFQKVQNEVLPARLQLCGTDDHVPEIERSVQTQKNENRTVCHAMPYKCLPRIMIREIIKQGNAFLNAFGSKDSVGDGLTPRNIIDNLPHVDYNDLKFELGQYVQLHIQEKITNTMKSRTIGAIVLGPRNIRGRYNYMSLETGAQIDGRVVAELPLTVEVIERVESFGLKQAQPYRASKMLKYEWRPGTTIGNDDAIIHIEDEQNVDNIVPDPIMPDVQPAGPNPFDVNTPVVEGLAPQGAAFEEIENEERQQLENEEREHQNQGAQVLNYETSDEETSHQKSCFQIVMIAMRHQATKTNPHAMKNVNVEAPISRHQTVKNTEGERRGQQLNHPIHFYKLNSKIWRTPISKNISTPAGKSINYQAIPRY